MKFVLVIIFCTQGICQTLYGPDGYQTYDQCEVDSKQMVEKIASNFPESYGQTFCMNQQEFEDLVNQSAGEQI
jgi:hypothetical protein